MHILQSDKECGMKFLKLTIVFLCFL